VDRRAFVVGGVGALAGSVGAKSARADRIPRVGILGGGPSPSWEAFRRGLRERGYVEGRTIVLEYRWHGGNVDRSAALVAELAQRKVDVIVATSVPVIRAAQQAAPTIPIVMAASFDAVESGLVVTLARPGGNTTGLSLRSGDVVGKRLELLREALRDMPRLAVLLGPPAPADPILLKALETVAKPMRVRLQLVRYPGGTQLEDAFFAMVRERATAVLVSEHPIFAFAERGRLAELAAKHRLPTMVSFREFVEAGALMSYGADLADLADRAAGYVDRILKGARPAELPVEEPIKFLFVINLKTAKALGLTIPPSLLARADQVIE
jgi:putative ABC transport system substrate-binding protein